MWSYKILRERGNRQKRNRSTVCYEKDPNRKKRLLASLQQTEGDGTLGPHAVLGGGNTPVVSKPKKRVTKRIAGRHRVYPATTVHQPIPEENRFREKGNR